MWQIELKNRANEVIRTAIESCGPASSGGRWGTHFLGSGMRHAGEYGGPQRSFRVVVTVSDELGQMPLASGKRVIRSLLEAGANVTGDPVVASLANILRDESADVERAMVLTIAALSKQRADLVEHVERLTRENTQSVVYVVDPLVQRLPLADCECPGSGRCELPHCTRAYNAAIAKPEPARDDRAMPDALAQLGNALDKLDECAAGHIGAIRGLSAARAQVRVLWRIVDQLQRGGK